MVSDGSSTDILLEEIRGQMSAVLEIVSDTQQKMNTLPTRDDFSTLQSDVATIRQVTHDSATELRLLDRRVTKLES